VKVKTGKRPGEPDRSAPSAAGEDPLLRDKTDEGHDATVEDSTRCSPNTQGRVSSTRTKNAPPNWIHVENLTPVAAQKVGIEGQERAWWSAIETGQLADGHRHYSRASRFRVNGHAVTSWTTTRQGRIQS